MQNAMVSAPQQHQPGALEQLQQQHQADLQQMQADHEARLSQLQAAYKAALTEKDAGIANCQAWHLEDMRALRTRTTSALVHAADRQRINVSKQLARQASGHAKVRYPPTLDLTKFWWFNKALPGCTVRFSLLKCHWN